MRISPTSDIRAGHLRDRCAGSGGRRRDTNQHSFSWSAQKMRARVDLEDKDAVYDALRSE
jgi:hypothetical protein